MPYKRLGIVIAINAVVMFLLTYALIDRLDHFFPNINRMYMALMMVAPMVLLMLFVMRSMYRNRSLNAVLYAGFGLLFVVSFWLARTQYPVGDDQFLRSMIPHHSSAILMCEHSAITGPEIVELCGEIVEAQEREIAQMKDILARR
jgi:hypothetical protein